MLRFFADLIGGPLDGERRAVARPPQEEIKLAYDFVEAQVESLHLHEARAMARDVIAERLRRPRQEDADHGWQTLLYRKGADGRYYYVKTLKEN